MSNLKAITATVVFEASAVNRDENIANNIQSLKKLRRNDGVYTFFSRASMRHHIFNALVKKHGWKPAKVAKDRDVIQFDILDESILTSEELDFFGYMKTLGSGNISISRKAPVGMTKAISLERWEGDMAFYANHDLVQRAREIGENADPNPFSKEEHLSLYKYSVVVDLENIGKERIVI
ncbi:type I-B CRISPR-associated protein Cas7/Cst2/DevR, partial [Thermotoga sp.]|uniref:type I-B CRISPR-associated protein Cas7/Cst2/DevR n=1 Tax=Thermotoga sp. TaxID=28240 RepID=UPI0025F5A3A5